jgi:hypothetical protein
MRALHISNLRRVGQGAGCERLPSERGAPPPLTAVAGQRDRYDFRDSIAGKMISTFRFG